MSKRSPRLQFTEEERASPELHKVIKKADKSADRLDKAEAKVPKKTVKVKARVLDERSGKITTKLHFEEVDKKRPASKLSHEVAAAPVNSVLTAAHRKVRESEEDNVGVESTHKLEEAGEGGVRAIASAHRSHKIKPYRTADRAEVRADRANLKALYRREQDRHPQSGMVGKLQQKRRIKKEYAAAKAGKRGTSKAAAKATQKAGDMIKKLAAKVAAFAAKNAHYIAIGLLIALVLVIFLNLITSCSVMVQSAASAVAATTYPAEDVDMLSAEAQYSAKEDELRTYLGTYEVTHSYNEYRYDLDDIEHDPYVLISTITAIHGGEWTIDEVSDTLDLLFSKQYILTESVQTQTRYRSELRMGFRTEIDPYTGEVMEVPYQYTVQVPYQYTICTVILENFDLSHVPVYIMTEEQLAMYSMYMGTLGNRPDLWRDSDFVGLYYNTEYEDYEIPAEALADEVFAAMIEEAEKYLGYPYVWGGSNPKTSFDCSGFVSWVLNHSGWEIGRQSAESLRQMSTAVSPANARPGDLIFFEGTYATRGASHVGIYVGDNRMIHCGDPIQYARIDTPYWQEHFLCFGRINP